jgi:surface antigen
MNHPQFIEKRLGKNIDYDNVFGYQCVDLVKQYINDVYAIEPGIFWWSANAGYESGSPFANSPKNFKKYSISDANNVLPRQGDIIFRWPSGSNTYGHVAVVDILIGSTKIKVLEQNGVWWGDGTGANAIRFKDYLLKNNVIWRYRYRKIPTQPEQVIIDLALQNNSKLYNITDDVSLQSFLAQTNKKIRELYT